MAFRFKYFIEQSLLMLLKSSRRRLRGGVRAWHGLLAASCWLLICFVSSSVALFIRTAATPPGGGGQKRAVKGAMTLDKLPCSGTATAESTT